MPNYPGKYFWPLLFLLFWIADLHAQKESFNWYFGQLAGISFKNSPPTALQNGMLSTREGSASISDNKGNLLFYTDGRTVYNRQHKPMPNGKGLKGSDNSTQSGIIAQLPGDSYIYYIFTVDAVEGSGNGLQYSIVNMQLDNGLGDIINDKKNIGLIYTGNEKVVAIRHRNCKDVWIISCNNSNFITFLLTENGISNSYKTTYAGFNEIADRGYLKSSFDGSKIAVTLINERVGVYNFDNSNGNISYFYTFKHPKNNKPYGEVYGLEFSPKVNFLYSANRFSGKLIQHNLNTLQSTLIVDSVILGALQNGPDGKLYIGQTGTNSLGIIEFPDSAGIKCNYEKNAISLGKGSCMDGLPNFPVYCNKPTFYVSYKDTCLGSPTSFSIYNSHPSASFKWKFNDPATANDTSTLQNPIHQFSKTGSYEVILIESAENVIDTIKIKLNIKNPFDPFPTKQFRICSDNYIGLTTGNPAASHIWGNGQKTKILWAKDPGFYKVTLIKDGCTLTDSIEIILVDTVKLDLGKDLELCAGEQTSLDAGENADSYFWSSGDTVQKISVNNAGKYWVRKMKEGCSISDTIFISYKDPVKLELGNDIKICSTEKITLDAGEDGDSYLWSTKDTTQIISIIKPGIYWVIKTKNNCSNTDTILVSIKDTVKLDLGNDSIYCADASVMLDAGPNADSYLWSTAAKSQTITVNKAGTYWAKRFKDACVASDTIIISFYSRISNIATDTVLCEDESETLFISAPAGSNFNWLPFGESNQTILAKKPGIYTVSFLDTNGCNQTKTFSIRNHCINSLVLPTVFKPNSQFSANKVFKATAANIKTISLKIYNRWGELLFESDDLNKGWDGKFLGKDCAEGIYLYVVQYSAKEDNIIISKYLSGTVTLLR